LARIFGKSCKSKAKPLAEVVYGFESGNRGAVIERNRTLVVKLKTQSGFLYKVCHDTLAGISCL
jgi:hypothetical protein